MASPELKQFMDAVCQQIVPKIKDKTHKQILKMSKGWKYERMVLQEICCEYLPIDFTNVIKQFSLIRYGGKVAGFYIAQAYTDDIGKGEIKFFYIKPGYRRKGIATHVIKDICDGFTSVYTDTCEEAYIKMIEKIGFVENGKCKETDDINYKWVKE
jgi:RimJ/RimL family protein N-acetyltransferase